eukprot:CAMPEP_0184871560 /NCGR_PEP_ID=MMETSP0580-20130426/40787_1 /TAXON_ID=1118495 /ORGANISM="Dactyliosolen fragilissimus" /LENGTH=144 /DNA_ID=CAMNT_0027374231 /DNA_START=115 /DNA_END=549 /DNA_ORIENTATION=-
MTRIIVTSVVAAAVIFDNSSAFSPNVSNTRTNTAISSTPDRREILGNFAKALSAGALVSGGVSELSLKDQPELLAGLSNPALGSFRGKFKGQSFQPGKGMRAHDDELIAGLSNPALGSFRGKFKGQSFQPGKGMRDHGNFDDLC